MERQIILDEMDNDKIFNEILDNSEQQGRHRATIANYTVEQVVHEYIIFHKVIAKFLKTEKGHKEEVLDLLTNVIETSILKSVGSFSLSIQEMQEKLICTLAHDVRNPLAAAQLALKMIEQEKKGKILGKMSGAAERSVRKAISLIEGLMNGITVKTGEGMMLDFENKNLMHDIIWVHAEAQEVYTQEIIFENNAKNLLGVFDSTAIRRLLENLVSNAVKYGSSLKPVTLTVEDKETLVEVKVHNHGTPVSIEKQQHIFQLFGSKKQRSKRRTEKLGNGFKISSNCSKNSRRHH